MVLTITLKDLIFVGIIILIICGIVLIKNLITTIKHTNKILEDTKTITDVAQKRVTEVDGVLDDVSESISGVADALRGKESFIQSISAIGKAVSSLIGLLKNKKEDKDI